MKQPAVYLLATGKRGTLYIGVTSNLVARTWQHREHVVEGFTKRYDVTMLAGTNCMARWSRQSIARSS